MGMHHNGISAGWVAYASTPITWITSLLAFGVDWNSTVLRLYSKDAIIEAVHFSHLPAAGFAHFAVRWLACS